MMETGHYTAKKGYRKTVYTSDMKSVKTVLAKHVPNRPTRLHLKHIVRTRFSGDTIAAIEFCIKKHNQHVYKLNIFINDGEEVRTEYALSRAIQSLYNIQGLSKLEDRYESKPVTYTRKKYTTS